MVNINLVIEENQSLKIFCHLIATNPDKLTVLNAVTSSMQYAKIIWGANSNRDELEKLYAEHVYELLKARKDY